MSKLSNTHNQKVNHCKCQLLVAFLDKKMNEEHTEKEPEVVVIEDDEDDEGECSTAQDKR